MIPRRFLLSLSLSTPALLVAPGARGQALRRVRIGQAADTVSFLPLAAARALDSFPAAGLSLDWTAMGGGDLACLRALGAGEIDLAAIGGTALLDAADKGQPVQAVASLMSRQSLELVLGNKAIERSGVSPADDPLDKRLAALKGLTLGVSAMGGAQEHAARWLARQAGLDPAAGVQVVVAGTPIEMEAALAAGRIDGFVLSPPGGLLAEDARIGQVLIRMAEDFPALKAMPALVLAVRTPVDAAKKELVVATCKALRAASVRLLEDPAGVAARMQAALFSGIKVPAMQAAVQTLRSGIGGHGRIDPASVPALLAYAGIAAGPDAKTAFWTNAFADEAGR